MWCIEIASIYTCAYIIYVSYMIILHDVLETLILLRKQCWIPISQDNARLPFLINLCILGGKKDNLKKDARTSLVVQWLRICLGMQGTQVRSWWEN